MQFKLISTAGLALVLASFQAQAQTGAPVFRAQASLTELNYSLVDLQPLDLTAPKLTLATNYDGSLLSATDGSAYTVVGDSKYVSGNLFSADTGSAITPNGIASVSKTGRDQLSSIVVDQGTFSAVPPYFPGLNGVPRSWSASGNVSTTSDWTLSANTRLTITGTFSIDVAVDAQNLTGLSELQASADRALTLQATAKSLLRVSQVNGFSTQTIDSFLLEVSAGQMVSSSGVNDLAQGSSSNLTQSFTLTVINNTNQAMALQFSGNALTSVSTRASNALVPEPGTWALMALGLGLMGWRVRAARRQPTRI